MKPLPILIAIGAALLSACNLGPNACKANDPEYDCDGNILVFCQADGFPEVRVDCDLLSDDDNERECNEDLQECQKLPKCGNGITEADEQCDDGDNNNGDGCDEDCAQEDLIACGDGDLDPGEECDPPSDANRCGATCLNTFSQIDCGVTPAITSGDIANVPGGFALRLKGDCTATNVTIQRDLVIEPVPGETATFKGNTTFIINGANSNVTFQGIDFDVNTTGNIFTINSGSLAIVNADMENITAENSSRFVVCFGSSRLLMDRVTINAPKGDVAVKLENFCQAIISNSVFANSPNASPEPPNKKPIELKDSPRLDLLFSTFVNNFTKENSIAKNTGTLNVHSVISSSNAAPPFSDAPDQSTSNFIEDIANLPDNDPTSIAVSQVTFAPPPFSGPIDGGDIAIGLGNLAFNPLTIFGIDIFLLDRNGRARPATGRDAGAIETNP